jgi:hypothetical protein
VALDKVQPLKLEDPSTGTQLDSFPTALNPQQDFVESMGIVIDDLSNRDEKTVIDRLGNDMRFKDGNNVTPVTLSQLVAGPGSIDRVWRRHFLLMGG